MDPVRTTPPLRLPAQAAPPAGARPAGAAPVEAPPAGPGDAVDLQPVVAQESGIEAPAPVPPPTRPPAEPAEVEGFMIAGASAAPAALPEERSAVEGLGDGPDPAGDPQAVADWCRTVAKSGLPLAERTKRIAAVLIPAVEAAPAAREEWSKATPVQVQLFVQETLEHTDAVERIGTRRGFDWSEHDMEPRVGKFHPEVAQYLAKPGRDESVEWAIARHNAAPHHAVWGDPRSTSADLAESATDIVNA